MKTSADLRPYVVTLLATGYLIAFWAFTDRPQPKPAAAAVEVRRPVATAVARTAPVRGRIRTRSS